MPKKLTPTEALKQADKLTHSRAKKNSDRITKRIALLAKHSPKAFAEYQKYRKRKNLVNNREIPSRILKQAEKERLHKRTHPFRKD